MRRAINILLLNVCMYFKNYSCCPEKFVCNWLVLASLDQLVVVVLVSSSYPSCTVCTVATNNSLMIILK